MKIRLAPILIFLQVISVLSCNKEPESKLDPVTESLVETLNDELVPLATDPLQWTNDELQFLDGVSNRSIVALGEATHGTSEFFQAKHRIFKYLVENHDFKIFAIEADFGESIFINEAVLAGDKSQIDDLMKTRMHFWTWKTNEVRALLNWMCDYNVGKPDAEKVQYWGFDCQFNTYHADMVKEQLTLADAPFFSFAEPILAEAKSATPLQFSGYSNSTFEAYLKNVDALKDSIIKYEGDITAATNERQYRLTLQLVKVIRQASEVNYYNGKQTATKNYRDEYMAKNTEWLNEYFDGAKMVVWAHNGHVGDFPQFGGTLGNHLKTSFGDEYATFGFLFATGSFTAITQEGDQFFGLNTQSMNEEPRQGSLPFVMSLAKTPVFTVKISDLQDHSEWQNKFLNGIQFFHIGALYNNKPADYYQPFSASYFDQLIFFKTTKASAQLQ